MSSKLSAGRFVVRRPNLERLKDTPELAVESKINAMPINLIDHMVHAAL